MSAPNILLVDDEPSILRYTKTLLEIENYHVETASSGEADQQWTGSQSDFAGFSPAGDGRTADAGDLQEDPP
jgi:CheY-like chemotaxis protein